MDWKRGIFRLWIIGSVAWVGLILWAEKPLSRLSDPIQFEALGLRIELPAGSTSETVQDILTQYLSERGKTPEGKAPQIAAAEAAAKFRAPSIYERLQPIVFEALLPPIGSLLVGIAMYWALAGFKRPKTNFADS